jgi:polygalacturonase
LQEGLGIKVRTLKFAKLLAYLTIIIIMTGCSQVETTGWDRVPEILKRIAPPTFPDKEFDVTKYGAIGDNKTDCKDAFARAVDACSKAGGGRVVVPAGQYISNGPIHLKSNINLHLDEKAEILFGTDTEDYLPLVHVRWEGTECYNYSPMIYAYMQKNIALTGKGTINAQAKDTWSKWKKVQGDDKSILRQMGNDLVPIKERVFGVGHKLRPSMVQFFDCRNVLIEDITFKDSPFWVVHPTYCINVTVRRITVDSWNSNNDGCDPDSCTDVLIEDCLFKTGDDSVAIKAGRDQDAWRAGKYSENIIVRNSKLSSKCNGLCIGSEMSGGVRNIFMENCVLGEAESVLFFKSNLDRGGFIENVYARNIDIEKCDNVIKFTNDYHGYRGNYYPTRFQNFVLEDIKCRQAGLGISIKGVKDAYIKNVLVKNLEIKQGGKNPEYNYVENLVLENVTMNDESYDCKIEREE